MNRARMLMACHIFFFVFLYKFKIILSTMTKIIDFSHSYKVMFWLLFKSFTHFSLIFRIMVISFQFFVLFVIFFNRQFVVVPERFFISPKCACGRACVLEIENWEAQWRSRLPFTTEVLGSISVESP